MPLCGQIQVLDPLGLQGRRVIDAHRNPQPGKGAVPAAAIKSTHQFSLAKIRQVCQGCHLWQFRKPWPVQFADTVLLCHLAQIPADGCQFIHIGFYRSPLFLQRFAPLSGKPHDADLVAAILCYLGLPGIRRPTPVGLEQFEHFLLTYQHITAPWLGDPGSIRPADHLPAVPGILHLQAEAELGVALDLFIHHTSGLLGSKHQVYPQGTANAGSADQSRHELRFICLQFRELICHNDQMGQGFVYLAVPVQLLIFVNVVNLVFLVLVEYPLASLHLTLQGDQGTAYIGTNIGDLAHHMGQFHQEIGHAAALIVNDDEYHIMGMVMQRHRQDPTLQQFTLAGTSRTCYQTVGTMGLLMDIQGEYLLPAHDSQRRRQGLVRLTVLPPGQGVKLLHPGYTEALQESQTLGNVCLGSKAFQFYG